MFPIQTCHQTCNFQKQTKKWQPLKQKNIEIETLFKILPIFFYNHVKKK